MCIILQNVIDKGHYDDMVQSPPNELVRMSTSLQDQKVSLGSNLLYQAVLTGQREYVLKCVLYVFGLIITAKFWVYGKTLLTGN